MCGISVTEKLCIYAKAEYRWTMKQLIHTFGVVLDSIALSGESRGGLETNAGTLGCSKDR
jgi:hypothetical protein